MNGGNEKGISLLSIGTGESAISRFALGKWAQLLQYVKAARSLVTDTYEAHERMVQSSEEGNKFFYERFNVQDGLSEIELDEWKKGGRKEPSTLDKITKLTDTYLKDCIDQKEAPLRVRDRLETVARRLVDIRRSRAKTSRWEQFSRGTRFRCVMNKCSRGQQPFYSRDEMWQHLSEDHGKPRKGHCSVEEEQQVSELIEIGKLDMFL